MQYRMKIIVVILFFISVQSVAQQTLRLPEAINIALKNSLDIQVSKNNVEANTILNNYGVAGGLPLVTGSAKSRLEQLQMQSEEYLNSQIQNIIDSVMITYYDIIRQQGYSKTLLQTIEVSKKRLDILKTQQSVGLANNADIFQAQLDLNTSMQALQTQQLIIDQAKTNMLTLLKFDPKSTINIEDTIIVDSTILLDSVLNRLSSNPDIIAANQQVKINELIIKETAAQRYPSVYFNTGYNYNRNQNSAGFNLLNQSYGPFVGLSLSIPIYNGSAYKRQQKVAEINTKNAELQKEILIRNYSSAVVKEYQAYENNLNQLKMAQENYKLAQQLLDLVFQRFQLRVATIIDLRVAQQSFENAGYQLINIGYAAKASEIELKRLSNTLTF